MPPIDPLTGPKLALAGRIVTMDPAFTVHDRGVVFIDAGRIAALGPATMPRPPGFDGVRVVNSRGTIYPGMIELHNHLSYNALPLWDVPAGPGGGAFRNRDQWSGIPEYRKLVSGPMKVLGMSPGLLPAVVRFVECKCLLAGVTTSQGIALFSNAGARRYYRGLIRNVEQTDDLDLPEAASKIADVDAEDAARFFVRLQRQTCFLLHLSEGTDDKARSHFLALRLPDGRFALTDALAGIHCAALRPEDFALMAAVGANLVWSPLSNLLLYGQTADVRAARDAGVRIALGSDWSPSGSKNLLGELKVARIVSEMAGGIFSDRELVAMVTRNPAAILKWQGALGSLEPMKRADLLVLAGTSGDPYSNLIAARETAIRLVMINGVPRFGLASLMTRLGVSNGERIRVSSSWRMLFLDQASADPDVRPISLGNAVETLKDALRDLPELAARLEQDTRPAAVALGPLGLGDGPVVWRLALDELTATGMDLRPRLSLPGQAEPTGPTRAAASAAEPLSQVLGPIALDAITIAGDDQYISRLLAQRHLPEAVKTGLRGLA